MKIEKVNENQIRCTLTREDLASRQIKLSELAYGTEKAKSLFRDMMQQANFEFGFEAENIPLMIEAIPLNAECIVLVITKVEDPEELDTRFARFAPSTDDYEEDEEENSFAPEEALDLFRRINEETAPEAPETEISVPAPRMLRFASLSRMMDAAALVSKSFLGESALYKDPENDTYLLLLSASGTDAAEAAGFQNTINILSEYGTVLRSSAISRSFLTEHCEPLIPQNALQSLGQ